jgi:hypothetical protein
MYIRRRQCAMATAFNCTKPSEGWELYSHFLGGLLLAIGANSKAPSEEDEVHKDKRERILYDVWAKLLGNLYKIMRQMSLHGYPEDADKMQRLVDMIVETDLTQPEVRIQIHKLHEELNPRVGQLDEMLAQLSAGNIPEG